MSTLPALPPTGLLGDLLGLPDQLADMIKGAIGELVDPNVPDPDPVVVDDDGVRDDVLRAVDAILAGIEFVLKFAPIVPDQYETPLRALAGALEKVKGWLS